MSSTYWPDLREELLRATSNTTHPSLQCTICYEVADYGEATHQAVILPCGHIFGKCCIEAWIASFIGRGTPTCPTCRVSVIHPGCRHVVKIIPVPTITLASPQKTCQTVPRQPGNVEKALGIFSSAVKGYHHNSANRAALQKFPRTIPEGGAVSHGCADCHVQELLRLYTTMASPMSMWTKIGGPEFISFTAKAGDEHWVLHSRGMRARVIRTVEGNPEFLQVCHQLRAFVESTGKGYSWPITDLGGLEFTMCVCRWEDPTGWT